MHATANRNYAPRKTWIDPTAEVEREAMTKGFNRGVAFTVAIFLGTFVVMDGVAALGRWLLRVIA